MTSKKNERLSSLDALRGFDMFWIAGGAMMVHALSASSDNSLVEWLHIQTEHAPWNGFRFYDLVFPLFLFIAGVSFPFSLEKRRRLGQSGKKIYSHVIKRGIILVLLGIVYNGFFRMNFEELRYASVLGRIGLAWMFAALIVMNAGIRWQAIWCLLILLSYWAMLMLVPVPGFGSGNLTMEGSLVAYIDRMLLPGVLYNEVHDPEGILSTYPAIATALLGMLTGELLRIRDVKLSTYRKFGLMLGAGFILLLLARLWNPFLPVNKNLWTSSFVLQAAGISLLMLSVFYLIIDIWKLKKWSFVFIIIGMNPITIYLAQAGMVDFMNTARYFFGGIISYFSNDIQPFLLATAYFFVSWLFLYFLYRQRIFLKV